MTIIKGCIYCGKDKPDTAFSREHIWPDALGGDFLPPLFQTTDVCESCNSLAGRFVDGAFLKSWFGQAERAFGWEQYLNLDITSRSVAPLFYTGPISISDQSPEDVSEMWLGPCGIHVIHIRDKDENDTWSTYAGGDPVARNRRPGRVYISLTTTNIQWIALALRSVKAHFKKTKRYIVNAQLPAEWADLAEPINRVDEQQKSDLRIVEFVQTSAANKETVGHPIKISTSADHRFLAKLALGLGHKILGQEFLGTEYAGNLRLALREADPVKREKLPIRGVGYLNASEPIKFLGLSGAWVIHIRIVAKDFALIIVTPSGRNMMIVISNTPKLWSGAQLNRYGMGDFYVVVPTLATAVGPISTAEYLNHILKHRSHTGLAGIEAKRVDPSALPPCR